MRLKLLTLFGEDLVDPSLEQTRAALLSLAGKESSRVILEDTIRENSLQLTLGENEQGQSCLVEYWEYLPGAGGQGETPRRYSCEGVALSAAIELFQLYLGGDETWRNKIDWELDSAVTLFSYLRDEVWGKGSRGEGFDFSSLEGKLPGEKIQKLRRRYRLALKVQQSFGQS